mmetsp:Transcript_26962/g.104830  ORF Transcript_26962/g.104830 Transcript_26962/m.104830 type:complete len:187 (+) Transcript_26962:5717-6277(+)
MYRLTSHMAAGNGSFPFAGKMSMFSKSIKVRTRGSVYLRAVTFDTDSDLARNMGSGEPQSHFVQSRSDPDWFYETNFSRVQGSTVFQSKTLHVSLETGEKLDDDVTGIDWDKLPIEDGDSLDEPEDDDHHDGLEDGDKNLLPEPVLLSMVHHQVRSRRYSSLQDNEYYDGDSEDLEDDEMPLQRYP